MLRRTFYTLSAALGLAAGSSLAFAADGPAVSPDHAELFKKLDQNGDGKVDAEEVPQEQRRLLERLLKNNDKNSDGKLTVEEFSAGLSEGRPQGDGKGTRPEGGPGGRPFNPEDIFKRLDADGDGKVKPDDVPQERREGFRRMLEKVDADGDGAASAAEFRKGFAMLAGQAPGTPPGAPPQGPGNTMEMVFKTLDADGNGALSKEELSNAAAALAKLDRNGDGSVSREEALPRPGFPGAPQPGQGRPEPGQFLGMLMRQDADGDKMISKDEAGERLKENFDRIDRNSDGKLDEAELKQMIERMQGAAGNFGGRRPEGGPKPEGERRPEGEKRPDGERKPEGRRPEGSAKPDAERPAKTDGAPKKE